MIQDPADELVAAVVRAGEDPSDADRRAVALVRRRFGLSLPLPFAAPPAPDAPVPIRPATAQDGPAIAAMKWRSWRVAYRGILPDAYLDSLVPDPPVGYWIGLGVLAPSARHGLFVAGERGVVLGVAEVRPSRDEDLDPSVTADVDRLYLDPSVRRRGIGAALLHAAVVHSLRTGSTDVRLWVGRDNAPARAFYEAEGFVADGATDRWEVGPGIGMEEVRYRLARGASSEGRS